MKKAAIFLFLIALIGFSCADVAISTQLTATVIDGNVTYVPTATPSPTPTTHYSSGGGGGGGSSTFTPKPQPTTITTIPTHISQQVVSTTPAPTTVIPTITATSTTPPVVIVGEGSGMVWGIVIIVVIGVTIVAYLWYRRRLENPPSP